MGRFSGRPRAGPDQSQCECCVAAVNLNAVSNEQGCAAAPKPPHSGTLLVGHSEERCVRMQQLQTTCAFRENRSQRRALQQGPLRQRVTRIAQDRRRRRVDADTVRAETEPSAPSEGPSQRVSVAKARVGPSLGIDGVDVTMYRSATALLTVPLAGASAGNVLSLCRCLSARTKRRQASLCQRHFWPTIHPFGSALIMRQKLSHVDLFSRRSKLY